jgi:hypothetical protein
MNSSGFFYSALVLFAISFGNALANPLVQFPSGPATWTVDVSVSPSAGALSTQVATEVVKVDVSQSERICRNEVTFKSGINRVTWSVTGTNLLLTQDPKGTAFLTPVTQFFNVPYTPSTFDWVSASYLQEKTPVDYGGRACFHYKGPAGEAWIESKTLLPVALDNGVRVASFSFGPPPASPVVLPAKFKQILDNYAIMTGMPKTHGPN